MQKRGGTIYKAGGKTSKESDYKICKFPVSRCGVGKGAENSSKDRASSRRVIPQDRIHSNESEMA